LRQSGKLPEGGVQSGTFRVAQGSFMIPEEREEPAPAGPRRATASGVKNVTAADQVIPDDLIVQGSLCVGFDCVNNESFGFDTIRMKENNTRIKFDDTSTAAGFPSTDWQLTANDSASGGANKFSIEDITTARVPFTIRGGATTNSIFVDSTGRVGFRTSTPVLDLHVNTSNTPGIRLEQNNSGGFTAQTWDIAGNEANFFVRDVTGGSRLPFRIRPGAPTSSIDINATGVGIGTTSPEVKVDIRGNSAVESGLFGTTFSDSESAQYILRRARGTSMLPTAIQNGDALGSFGFRGHNGTGFALTNSALVVAAAEESWSAGANGSRLFFNTTPIGSGTPQTRLMIKGSGNVGIGTVNPIDRLEVSGGNIRVTGGSFIDDGTTLNVPDYVFEPGYPLIPPAELRAFISANGHLPNVPNREQIKATGLNLSRFQMTLLEKVEELTLYTLAQEEKVASLSAENASLAARLEAMERRLAAVAPASE
jgi:hypothetical protein